MEFNDIIGKRYGDLVVKEFSRSVRRNGIKNFKHFYNCCCDCGKIKEIVRTNLITGHTKSCGCRNSKNRQNNKGWKGFGEISGRTWYHIQDHAKSRRLNFEISIEQAWQLFEKQNGKCAMTGLNLSLYSTKKKLNSERTASLDRIDSTKGYIVGNVQWVHKEINMMKGTMSNDKFIDICKLVANRGLSTDATFPSGLGRGFGMNCLTEISRGSNGI